MKKLLLSLSCLVSTATFASNSATFVLPSLPQGLALGSFEVRLSTVEESFVASGPVTNYGNYGLVGVLNNVNAAINDTYNDQPVTHFPINLRIRLTCSNYATVAYTYHAAELNVPGKVIVVEPPAHCAVTGTV